jgi:UDP-glucose 4-epimerase
MRKIIVTGGAGFIGSHTAVELCAAGYSPVIVDNFSRSDQRILARMQALVRQPLPSYAVDCRSADGLRQVLQQEGPIDGVIHFAAYKAVGESVRDPLSYFDNNLNSLAVLLRVMNEAGIANLVFSSSCTVYGQPAQLPVTELTPEQPAESPYGRTKQICEAMLNDCVRSGQKLKAVTLRYFNPVGAHPSGRIGELPIGKPENLVPYITQTAVGLRDKLTIFGSDYPTGDGTCVRDYIHVVDLAKAHVSALDWLAKEPRSSFNEAFNVGTGRGVSVLEAVHAFERVSGRTLNYEIGPRRPGDVVATYASVEKAEQQLGWRAELSIDDALRDAYHWQLALDKDPLGAAVVPSQA